MGLRRSTPLSREATALADGYAGLPPGVTRWRLAAALRAAARPLGLTAAMLRLLEHYIDLTYDQDWAGGAEPVVTRPLVEIAETLGRSERQIRNVERSLAERGLLAWRDSGNHHRKGRRDHVTGRLVYAYGPSLAPLGARANEIIAAAASARADVATARRLRIAASALRRRIRADLAAAAAIGLDVKLIGARLATITPSAPAGVPLSALQARRDALASVADALSDQLAWQRPPVSREASCEAEISVRHHTDTSPVDAMNGDSIGRRGWDATAATEDRCGVTDGGARYVPITLALAAAGEALRDALKAQDRRDWPGLVAAARDVAPLLGVDQALWAETCARLGRPGAALAVLVIERQAGAAGPDGAPAVRRPPAYLRAMLARAAQGSLHLDRSVRAWARKTPVEHSPADAS
jgi:replication initiation protein RepC